MPPRLMSEFMRLALSQANLAIRAGAYPYPGVGVVIVFGGQQVIRVHNGTPGSDHAEVKAIREARIREIPLNQTILYSNLEPCCNAIGLVHSCVKEIIQAKIPEVHISIKDPYHLVSGKGIDELQEAGVKVVLGEMEEEARWLLGKYLRRFCPHCGYPLESDLAQ